MIITDICAALPYAPGYGFRWENYGGREWSLPLRPLPSSPPCPPLYRLDSEWTMVSWTLSAGLTCRPRIDGIAVMLTTPDGEQVWFHWVERNDTIITANSQQHLNEV